MPTPPVNSYLSNELNDLHLPTTELKRRFNRLMDASLRSNPVVLPAGDEQGTTNNTVATMTKLGADYTNGYNEQWINSTSLDGKPFTVFGGPFMFKDQYTEGVQAWAATYDTTNHYKRKVGTRVAFRTRATVFDLKLGVSAVHKYRIMIDGRYISRTPFLTQRSSGGAFDYVHIVLPANANNRKRRIDIEMAYPEANFGGVCMPTGYYAEPIDNSETFRMLSIGDSLGEATGTDFAFKAYNTVAGYLLGGIDLDMVQCCLGGTGYVNNGGGNGAVIDHITDLDRQVYHAVLWGPGINDSGSTNNATLAAKATEAWTVGRQKLPNAPFYIHGIARDDSAAAEASETILKNAFNAWGDNNSIFIPLQTPGFKLFTGLNSGTYNPRTGENNFANAINGGGSDDVDNTHPDEAGHDEMGRYIARTIRVSGR